MPPFSAAHYEKYIKFSYLCDDLHSFKKVTVFLKKCRGELSSAIPWGE